MGDGPPLVPGWLERLDLSERTSIELMAAAGDAASGAVLGPVSGIPPEELDAAMAAYVKWDYWWWSTAGSEVLYRVAHP